MKHIGKTLLIKTMGLLTAFSLIFGVSVAVAETGAVAPVKKGTYHVVGIGPGDADLITVKARDVIQKADIVFCRLKTRDNLSSVVDFKGKEVVDGYNVLFRYYGKDCADVTEKQRKNPRSRMSCEEYHSKQQEFAARVKDAVAQGKHVVLLSGGDPTIYGPDIWSLRELADLDPVLIPGLSSFNAATAALKVSLGEVVLTAPFKSKNGKPAKDSLENIVKHDKATVVIFMPRDMNDLLTRLSASCPGDTPMAVVSNAGRREKEKTILGTVADMPGKLKDKDTNLSLIYVGKALKKANVTYQPDNKGKGTFYLVGAGPGDADQATLRAMDVLLKADMIFASKKLSKRFEKELAGKEIINGYHRLFPFYGKKCGDVTKREQSRERMSCDEYHAKQVELAAMVRKAVAKGKNVAMLDSGDPLIYGPCSWTLTEFRDIETQVVPGLSCFNAANAALQKGVTEGRTSHSVILASGWTVKDMSALQGTMVLFTMRTEFKTFVDALSQSYPSSTPLAIVEKAGYAAKEKVIHSTLGAILKEKEEKLPFEYLLYVGDFLN